MKTIAQLVALGYTFESFPARIATCMTRPDGVAFALVNTRFKFPLELAVANDWGDSEPVQMVTVAGLFRDDEPFPFLVLDIEEVKAIRDIGININHLDRMTESIKVLYKQQSTLLNQFYNFGSRG